jgi:hypothetical protein
MLLSRIVVDPATYQKRDTPFSEKTVAAIVEEGIVLSKFDAIPLLPLDGAQFVVGGDGHSRYEAIKRLGDRLPADWRTPNGVDWDIPHKLVDHKEAKINAWTANLRGTGFSAVEESKVFQEMLDAGYPLDKVATLCHVSNSYVKQALPLNGLCTDIRAAVGLTHDAGGVEKFIAQAMAVRFQRFGIDKQAQQQLWHRVFAKMNLTRKFVESFLDRIGKQFQDRSKADDGFLFEIPVGVDHVIQKMKDRAQAQRKFERGLAWLMQTYEEARDGKGADIIAEYPELQAILATHGMAWLSRAKTQTQEDATLLSEVIVAA